MFKRFSMHLSHNPRCLSKAEEELTITNGIEKNEKEGGEGRKKRKKRGA